MQRGYRHTLCAMYDLGVSPTSFDIAPFLLYAQSEALERGCRGVRLAVIEGEHHGVRFEGDDYEALYPPEARLWKVGHIIQALPRLCPLVDRQVITISRSECKPFAAAYPHFIHSADYNAMYLRAWRGLNFCRPQIGFRATRPARQYVAQWLESIGWTAERRLVTMTLRESRWSPNRNTDSATWAKVAAKLLDCGFFPLLVPDTEKAFVERVPEWRTVPVAALVAFDLELRMALYEEAYLNLFTGAGPGLLAIGSQSCSYIYFGVAYGGTSESDPARIREMGMLPNTLPFIPPANQRWLWGPLPFERVWRAIEAFHAELDGREYAGPAPEWAVPFDEQAYLEANPDVARAVQQRKICSGLQHFAIVGERQGRKFPGTKHGGTVPDSPAVVAAQRTGAAEEGGPTGVEPPAGPSAMPGSSGDGLVTAVYDLVHYPESFDFCLFLAGAEVYRHRLGLSGIRFIILTEIGAGWQTRTFAFPDEESWQRHLQGAMWWRIHHLLAPMTALMPTVRQLQLSDDRAGVNKLVRNLRHCYPYQPSRDVACYQPYRETLAAVYAGRKFTLFDAPPGAHHYVEQWLEAHDELRGRRLIVVTLRQALEAKAQQERNSNVPAWLAWVRELRDAGYGVVVVPDTDAALCSASAVRGEEPAACTVAAFNIAFRIALYQRAYLNFFPTNGVAMLAMLVKGIRYVLFFKALQPVRGTDNDFLENLGFRTGETAATGPFQRMVWEPDTLENIRREGLSMLRMLEQAGAGLPGTTDGRDGAGARHEAPD